MHSYRIRTSAAGAELNIKASSLPELFSGSLLGMNELLADECRREEDDFEEWMSLSSPDTATLLVRFLNEILTLSHQGRLLFRRAEFRKLEADNLEARVFGTYAGPLRGNISAVQHAGSVEKNDAGGYEASFFLDV